MKNIRPRDKKGLRHGYWEVYNKDGSLVHKGKYIHDIKVGYHQWFYNLKEYFIL